MPRRPFNVLTFLGDRMVDANADFTVAAMTALQSALNMARTNGDAAQFDRLAMQYQRYRQDLLALDPQATVPEVSLDYAAADRDRYAA